MAEAADYKALTKLTDMVYRGATGMGSANGEGGAGVARPSCISYFG